MEDYQNRLIAQEEKINQQTAAIEEIKLKTTDKIKNLEEDNQALSEEVKKLRDKNINEEGEKLPGTIQQKEIIMKYQVELRKLQEELATKEFMVC